LYTASDDMEDALVNQLIDEEMEHIIERFRQNPDFVPQQGSNIESYIARNAPDASALPSYLHGLTVGRHIARRGSEEFHVSVRHINGTSFYVAYDIGLHEQREWEMQLLILLSMVAGGIASLLGGYFLSGLLIRQITDLAQQVRTLTHNTTSVVLAQPGQDEEVAQLARALDDYRARLAQVLRREQEFTAEASHELRTPLTAIRTSCELLAADATFNGKSRERIGVIDNAARRMSAQLEALLFLAREQPLAGSESVNVAECVHEAAAPCQDDAQQRGVRMEINVAPDAVLTANYDALHLALSNLLRNAVRHTQNGSVRVELRGNRLSVADTGRGIAPEELPHVFERFYRGSGADANGTGLGLAIVKRVCDQSGWSITAESAPGHGSTFTVTFEGETKTL